ncbi:MAG: hypothetical protein NVSMB66_3470 [Candidatus Doudnabacteria bacterium]
MKKLFKTIFITALLTFVTAGSFSQVAAAAKSTVTGSSTKQGCSFDSQSTTLCNPLPDNNLDSIVVRALKYILGIIGSVAVVVIVIAGFRMVASQGNSEAIKGAKNSIQWAIIGLVVAFLAYAMVAIVSATLKGSAN